MSDYSDAMNDNLVNELEKKFLDRMVSDEHLDVK